MILSTDSFWRCGSLHCYSWLKNWYCHLIGKCNVLPCRKSILPWTPEFPSPRQCKKCIFCPTFCHTKHQAIDTQAVQQALRRSRQMHDISANWNMIEQPFTSMQSGFCKGRGALVLILKGCNKPGPDSTPWVVGRQGMGNDYEGNPACAPYRCAMPQSYHCSAVHHTHHSPQKNQKQQDLQCPWEYAICSCNG